MRVVIITLEMDALRFAECSQTWSTLAYVSTLMVIQCFPEYYGNWCFARTQDLIRKCE